MLADFSNYHCELEREIAEGKTSDGFTLSAYALYRAILGM